MMFSARLIINMKTDDTNPNRFALVKPRLMVPVEDTTRRGRGFSYGEIEESGASVDEVKSANLRIDHMRRSVHEVNVKSLQTLLGTTGKARSAQRSKPKEKGRTAGKVEVAPRKKESKTKTGKKK
jgi:ribosomal protein L13E